jgi:inner membrane protein
VVFSVIKANPLLARLALTWALIYPAIGLVQRDRAIDIGHQIANQRGHQPIRLEAKPSFANLLVWKTIYETEHRFYIDAVRAGVEPIIYPGQSVSKIILLDDYPWLAADSQQAKDIARFHWFSNGYIARDPNNPQRIIDVRYSMVANEINALWSIELAAHASNAEHATYLTQRERSAQTMDKFWRMIRGQSLATQSSRQ